MIAKIDELGGSINAIDFIKNEIEESAFGYHERYRIGQDIVVGVNQVRRGRSRGAGHPAGRPRVRAPAGGASESVQGEPRHELVERRLEEIREAARGTGNMLPVLRQALKDRCTLGEVCAAMRDVFGEYKPTF